MAGLHRFGDDGLGAERRTVVVPSSRCRRSGAATGHHSRGRVGRRADRLRLARHVRPSRPCPGAPCRRPRRRDVAGTPRAAVHVQPDGVRATHGRGHRGRRTRGGTRGRLGSRRPGRRRQSVRLTGGRNHARGRRRRVHRPEEREALRCHRSQVTDTSFFLEMPAERFRQAFGTEWFIEAGVDAPMRRGWLFDIPD